MSELVQVPGHRSTKFGLTVAILLVSVTLGGRWGHSDPNDRELSSAEVQSTARTIMNFVDQHGLRLPSLEDGAAALKFGPVRFGPYFGYLATAYCDEASFHVALNEGSPYVFSFTDKNRRNLQDRCNPEGIKREEYINREEAIESASKFVETQGMTALVSQLKAHRAKLCCFGSEEYYQFVWRETRDDNGIAIELARVEVLINPLDASVYSYAHSRSKAESAGAFDSRLAKEVALGSGLCGHNCGIGEMTLFSYHDRDGGVRPVWEIRVTTISENTMTNKVLGSIVVDAETREIISMGSNL